MNDILKWIEQIIKFDITEIEECKFHQYKSTINKILESNKFPFGKEDFEYFNGYKEIRPLCIYFPEMCIYKRYSDQSKCIYFMKKRWKTFE